MTEYVSVLPEKRTQAKSRRVTVHTNRKARNMRCKKCKTGIRQGANF